MYCYVKWKYTVVGEVYDFIKKNFKWSYPLITNNYSKTTWYNCESKKQLRVQVNDLTNTMISGRINWWEVTEQPELKKKKWRCGSTKSSIAAQHRDK